MNLNVVIKKLETDVLHKPVKCEDIHGLLKLLESKKESKSATWMLPFLFFHLKCLANPSTYFKLVLIYMPKNREIFILSLWQQ